MRFHSILFLTVLLLHGTQPTKGQEKATIDSKAPDFTLKDQSGNQISLDGLLKTGNVALVFHRSANW